MAEKLQSSKKVKKVLKVPTVNPLERKNFIIIAIGLIVIVLGYIALSTGGVTGTMPLVVAPILLVLGYCVIIPFGIMFKVKEKSSESELAEIENSQN